MCVTDVIERMSSLLPSLLPSPCCADVDRLQTSLSSVAVAFREQELLLRNAEKDAGLSSAELRRLREEHRTVDELEGFVMHCGKVAALAVELGAATEHCDGIPEETNQDRRERCGRLLRASLHTLRGEALQTAAQSMEALQSRLEQMEAAHAPAIATSLALREELSRIKRGDTTSSVLLGVRERSWRSRISSLEQEVVGLKALQASESLKLRAAQELASSWQTAAETAEAHRREALAKLAAAEAEANSAVALASEVARLRAELQLRPKR